jgi:2-phosphosulfolactate phosphatase
MQIHLTLTARDIKEEELSGSIAVVIDVLRATSVMVTALSNGARWIRTVAEVEEARAERSENVLLGGERHALPIEGFDFGNSPLEYIPERVSGRGIVLTTTNGTQAFSRCSRAREVLAGSFLNYRAVTNYLADRVLPVEIVCAGTNGEFTLDDFLCAGLICTTLLDSGEGVFDDLGRLAIQVWEKAKEDVHAALAGSRHYNILKSKGFEKDLDHCLQIGVFDILPKMEKGSGRFLIPGR